MKIKCDSQEPCARCRRRSWKCSYTRTGYVDPYLQFCRGEKHAWTPDNSSSTATTDRSANDRQDVSGSTAQTAGHDANSQTESLQDGSFSVSSGSNGTNPDPISIQNIDTCAVADTGVVDFDFSLMDFDMNLGPLWPPDPSFADFDPVCSLPYVSMDSDLSVGSNQCHIEPTIRETDLSRGFSVEQSDPVHAKCGAIRAVLRSVDTSVSEDELERYSSREQVLQYHQLYGRHFQYHFPILHSPSHSLLTSSPILLLAMVLAGAHYSQNSTHAYRLPHFAVRLITHIEMEQVV